MESVLLFSVCLLQESVLLFFLFFVVVVVVVLMLRIFKNPVLILRGRTILMRTIVPLLIRKMSFNPFISTVSFENDR